LTAACAAPHGAIDDFSMNSNNRVRPPMAKKPTKPPRTRLDPDVRRTQILDCAAQLIADDGLTAFSMDRVAKRAGVSKALVYAYYPNQTALLQALLIRDSRRIQREHLQAVNATHSFPEMVRQTTHIAMVEAEERGAFVQQLLAEPAVAAAMGPIRADEHSANVNFLAKHVAAAFGTPLAQSRKIVEIGLGITAAAGAYMRRSGAPRAEIEELTAAMIIGAARAGAALHAGRARKTTRKR
jgi:TetR/AcrR family transcriptional regulator, fatty acid biosynthesis regulator